MRPIPSGSRREESKTEKIESIAEEALELLQREGYWGRPEKAVNAILRGKDDCDHLLGEAVDEVESQLPDGVEYEFIFEPEYGEGLEIKGGCPHCGNKTVFNADYRYSYAQFVEYRSDEDYEGRPFFIDDGCTVVDELRCGRCHTPLLDDDDGDSDD